MSHSKKDKKEVHAGSLSVSRMKAAAAVVGAGPSGMRAALELAASGCTPVVLIDEGSLSTDRRVSNGCDSFFAPALGSASDDSPAAAAQWMEQAAGWERSEAMNYAHFSREEYFRYLFEGVSLIKNSYGAPGVPAWVHQDPQRLSERTFYSDKNARAEIGRVLEQRVQAAQNEGSIVRLKQMFPVSLLRNENGHLCGLLLSRKDSPPDQAVLLAVDAVVSADEGWLSLFQDRLSSPVSIFSGMLIESGLELVEPGDFDFALTSANGRLGINGPFPAAVPSIYSTDDEGGDRRAFLENYFVDYRSMVAALIDKGNRWEFRMEGSGLPEASVLDLAVWEERQLRGRRVFMDFRENPGWGALGGGELWNEQSLRPEDYNWIRSTAGMQTTPWERVLHFSSGMDRRLNKIAIHPQREPVEIALSAVAFEGVIRPGSENPAAAGGLFTAGSGSSGDLVPMESSRFISGQLAGVRAAMEAAEYLKGLNQEAGENIENDSEVRAVHRYLDQMMPYSSKERYLSASALRKYERIITRSMSEVLGIVRDTDEVEKMIRQLLFIYFECVDSAVLSFSDLELYYSVRYRALTALASASSVIYYLFEGGGSRKSFLITGSEEDSFCCANRLYKREDPSLRGERLVCRFTGEEFVFRRERV